MKIIEIEDIPKFENIITLINEEWPIEFGDINDYEKIKKMEDSFNLDTDTTKLLIYNSETVGFYRYTLWPREKSSSEVHILDISILSDYQRKGLGSLLMEDIITDCKKKKYSKVLSRTFKNNQNSIRLHKKFDFIKIMDTEDSFVWELSL